MSTAEPALAPPCPLCASPPGEPPLICSRCGAEWYPAPSPHEWPPAADAWPKEQ